jgi:UDP-N-acetylglucosamine:LPS N-acetylglucosamine transferase
MKILYIHQYFKTPSDSGGTRSYWIAKGLVEKKHDVTVLSAKNNMDSRINEVYIEGIKVVYFNVSYSNKMSVFRRLLSFLSFMSRTCIYVLKEKNVDLIFATSTPLTIGIPALFGKFFKRIPYVFEVRDLWPEVPIQMGALKNTLVIKAAVFLEKTIYKNANHIITLSPGMKEGVLKVVKDQSKLSMTPNMAKVDEFFPREISNEAKK